MSDRKTGKRRRARMPGRPAGEAQTDVRSALLEAARRLFLKHGFDKVTARQIAAAAGTTPAMIHYYFSNKLGLYRVMLQEAIGPIRQLLDAEAGDSDASPGVDPIVGGYMRTAAANPWVATFIINEVLAAKARFRGTFIRDIASHVLPRLVEIIERGRAAGRFRADLDANLAALSLVSLCVFPFVSRAVTAPVLGIKLDGADLDRFIAHSARLYLEGIRNPSAPTVSPRPTEHAESTA